MKSVRRIGMLMLGGIIGILEAVFVTVNTTLSAWNCFIIGMVIFILLQLVCWGLYSIAKKDKACGKIAINAYFISYVLYGLTVGLIASTPLFDLIFYIVSMTAISKLLPILIYGVIYSNVDVF